MRRMGLVDVSTCGWLRLSTDGDSISPCKRARLITPAEYCLGVGGISYASCQPDIVAVELSALGEMMSTYVCD